MVLYVFLFKDVEKGQFVSVFFVLFRGKKRSPRSTKGKRESCDLARNSNPPVVGGWTGLTVSRSEKVGAGLFWVAFVCSGSPKKSHPSECSESTDLMQTTTVRREEIHDKKQKSGPEVMEAIKQRGGLIGLDVYIIHKFFCTSSSFSCTV